MPNLSIDANEITMCPKCKEEIKKDASLCKHCGSDLLKEKQIEKNKEKDKEEKTKRGKLIRSIVFVILAIIFWYFTIPVGILWFVWKKTKLQKKNKIIISVVVAVFGSIILSLVFASKPNVTTSANQSANSESVQLTEEQKVQAAKETEEKRISDFKEQLQKEIDGIENFNGDEYRSDVTKIQGEVFMFSLWAALSKNASQESDEEIKNLGTILAQKVSQLQVREFPLLRKAWADLMKTQLWVNDVDVEIYGTANNTLELTGYYFASNSNVQQIQLTIADMLKLLRFDRVNYKWYAYDSSYPYYTIESLKDSEIE